MNRALDRPILGLRGERVNGADVMIFPEDPALRSIPGRTTVNYNGGGRYAYTHLPQGRYLAIALPRAVWFDPRDTDRLALVARRATAFELKERGSTTVDLTVDAIR